MEKAFDQLVIEELRGMREDVKSVEHSMTALRAEVIEKHNALADNVNEVRTHFSGLSDTVTTVRLEVAGLKVRSGLWGLVAGMLPAIGGAVWLLLK